MPLLPPAEIGMAEADIDTPALLVELEVFERNLHHLVTQTTGTSVRLRPHAKTHKCPEIALRQIALGAVGVCCQKVGEAEAMVDGGVRDVLVSNQIVGANKLSRLAALAKRAKISVCVDNLQNVKALGRAAQEARVEIGVLVEIDVGAGRCGVQPGEEAVALARLINQTKGLRFVGLQAYQGRAQHLRDYASRQKAIQVAVHQVQETQALLAKAQLSCHTIAGAGTGTYLLEATSGIYNELQAGSYVFMDADYGKNLDESGAPISEFGNSLFILTTVMSHPTPERAVLDAGLKAFSVDSGLPAVVDVDGAEFVGASDEHGVLRLTTDQGKLKVGKKVRLIPGHCDPTVNLYDWLVGVRHGRVEALWPITGRGAIR